MTNTSMIFFVTGVCGAGKSSVIPHLLSLLDPEKFAIHDFDKRGVPNNADRSWRIDETKHWLNVGFENSLKGIKTIICGFARPTELMLLQHHEISSCILLDIDEPTLRGRIQGRYTTEASVKELFRATGKSVEAFIEDNANFLKTLRAECKDHNCLVVDTNLLTSEQVAKQIVGSL
ncbi:MAG: hypothetical protein AAB467_04435 [Patescibacteria group bacterium]